MESNISLTIHEHGALAPCVTNTIVSSSKLRFPMFLMKSDLESLFAITCPLYVNRRHGNTQAQKNYSAKFCMLIFLGIETEKQGL